MKLPEIFSIHGWMIRKWFGNATIACRGPTGDHNSKTGGTEGHSKGSDLILAELVQIKIAPPWMIAHASCHAYPCHLVQLQGSRCLALHIQPCFTFHISLKFQDLNISLKQWKTLKFYLFASLPVVECEFLPRDYA